MSHPTTTSFASDDHEFADAFLNRSWWSDEKEVFVGWLMFYQLYQNNTLPKDTQKRDHKSEITPAAGEIAAPRPALPRPPPAAPLPPSPAGQYRIVSGGYRQKIVLWYSVLNDLRIWWSIWLSISVFEYWKFEFYVRHWSDERKAISP
jgi:hypothetical protein